MTQYSLYRGRFRVLVVLCIVVSLAWLTDGRRATAQEPDADEAAEPEVVDLTTKDGVSLKATFYPGAGTEKTVPIILLHDYKGDRSDFEELAKYLQSLGHAVMVPDLRGHGDSTRVLGSPRELVATRMKVSNYGRMVADDMEAIKRYLMELNNKSKLNIQKLCIVGAGMGASVAIAWAAQDWSWPEFAALKQGRDVKSLVLLSPDMNFRGIKLRDALMHPAVSDRLSVQIILGQKKNDSRRDADAMYKMLTRNRPDQEKAKLAYREVFLEQLDTSLQGIKLLEIKKLLVDKRIAKFIDLRLTNINTPDYRWADRSRK